MQNNLCVIGNAKVAHGNPITYQYTQFFITFIVDATSGEIIDLEVSTALRLTNEFIRTIFIGGSLCVCEERISNMISTRYLGSSQRAILTAYKDAVRKYRSWLAGEKILDE